MDVHSYYLEIPVAILFAMFKRALLITEIVYLVLLIVQMGSDRMEINVNLARVIAILVKVLQPANLVRIHRILEISCYFTMGSAMILVLIKRIRMV